jgi:hypothetical protein
MLISDKQQQANRQNAQRSTGPKTPEGRKAVRYNALTWGLRARSLMLRTDVSEEYQELWDALDAEWHPQTATERHYLEQMVVSQWLLIRNAASETRIYEADLPLEKRLALLDRVSVQRVRLERSFTTAARELKQLQQRQASREQPAQPAETVQSAPEPVQTPGYVMSESPEVQPVFCAAQAVDSR